MRRKCRTAAVALVAVFALGAVASASASAAMPEFIPGEGQSFPITGTASLGTASDEISTSSGVIFMGVCRGYKATAEITGAKTASFTTEFTHCANASGEECRTAGAEPGHVALPGTVTPVYLNKTRKEAALLLKFTETLITCPHGSIKVRGSILIPATPVNTKTSVLTLSIKGEKGKPKYTEYENESGKISNAKFETNGGAGYIVSALNISEEIKLNLNKSLTLSA